MLRIRLCQKLPVKLESVWPSTHSPSPWTAATSDLPPLGSNSSRSSVLPQVSQRRFKCGTTAQHQRIEKFELIPHGEKSITTCDGSPPQSITLFRFDDVSTSGTQGDSTHVHVLEQWKQLLESLRAIVDEFQSHETSMLDVSAVRHTLERHHLVRFLVRPYSYTAEDITYLSPGYQLSFDSRGNSISVNKEAEVVPPILTSEVVVKDANASEFSSFGSVGSVTDDERFMDPCIRRLERESLRAVMMLSSGGWNDRHENDSTRCDIIDLAQENCTLPTLNHASSVMLCQGKETDQNDKSDPTNRGRPNRDQLSVVQDYMAENLPKIFVNFHSYDIYTPDVVFENNWYFDQSYITTGVTAYAMEIAKLRLFVHLRYANVKMHLLKATTNEAEGIVQIRWRISGIPQVKAIMFWKFLPWTNRNSTGIDSEWLDGFSTFFVDNSGLIYKHRMDRIIPDEGVDPKKKTVIEKLASKIAAGPPVATLSIK